MANPQWFGVSEDYLLDYTGRTPTWETLIANMKRWGFNVARLGFAFADAPATSNSVLNMAALNQVLSVLDSNGIKAVLDCHNWQDHVGFFGSPEWIADWTNLANTIKGDNRIVGLELFNEPVSSTWHSSIIDSAGVLNALNQCMDAIRATGNTHEIIYPSPWYYRGLFPQTSRNIIVDWHAYMTTAYEQTVAGAKEKVAYDLLGMNDWMTNKGYRLWVGETGPRTPPITYDVEKTYVVGTINNCVATKCGFSLWAYSLNHWTEGSYADMLATSNYRTTTPIPVFSILMMATIIGFIYFARH